MMHNDYNLMIYLLGKEVEALRSVLSEWDADKSSYVQWIRANKIREVIALLDDVL